jgi:hypothetical protein
MDYPFSQTFALLSRGIERVFLARYVGLLPLADCWLIGAIVIRAFTSCAKYYSELKPNTRGGNKRYFPIIPFLYFERCTHLEIRIVCGSRPGSFDRTQDMIGH